MESVKQSQTLYSTSLHLLWLIHIQEQNAVTPEVAEASWLTLLKVQASMNSLVIPAGCTGPNGEISMLWGFGSYHMQVELVSASKAEWLFRNRSDVNDYWGCDWNITEDIPPEVINRLKAILPISS